MTTSCTRPRRVRALAGLVIVAALLAPLVARAQAAAAPADQDQLPPALAGIEGVSEDGSPNFGRAAVEVFGLNALVWSYDRFIREGGENPVFRIGFNSWQENLETGWTWDDNNFTTNQYAHPYHGNLYYNAARSNGYTFWQSVPFAFAGSLMWEYFGEVHNPAMNDWISTSMGGIALGEIFHRLATTVRDNTATGSSRNWRELGGFAIDPVGGQLRLYVDGTDAHTNACLVDLLRSIVDLSQREGANISGYQNSWNAK